MIVNDQDVHGASAKVGPKRTVHTILRESIQDFVR